MGQGVLQALCLTCSVNSESATPAVPAPTVTKGPGQMLQNKRGTAQSQPPACRQPCSLWPTSPRSSIALSCAPSASRRSPASCTARTGRPGQGGVGGRGRGAPRSWQHVAGSLALDTRCSAGARPPQPQLALPACSRFAISSRSARSRARPCFSSARSFCGMGTCMEAVAQARVGLAAAQRHSSDPPTAPKPSLSRCAAATQQQAPKMQWRSATEHSTAQRSTPLPGP